MLRLAAAARALMAGVPALVAAQAPPDPAFDVIGDDFVLRFDYRPPTPTGRGTLRLHELAFTRSAPIADVATWVAARRGTGRDRPERRESGLPELLVAAMKARAQGVTKVEFVIHADGSPGDVRVLEAPHPA
jgi:hypothetical protein